MFMNGAYSRNVYQIYTFATGYSPYNNNPDPAWQGRRKGGSGYQPTGAWTITMSAHSFSTLSRFLLLFLLVVLLAGCQENFYTGLEENDANEILAVLRNHGLKLNKEPGEKKTWNLTIEKSQLPQAMALLAKNGLPRDRFENMGQIFKKEGLISSPLEEKARFTYALSQELSETITLIDGVLAARVHVVPQEIRAMKKPAAS